MPTDLQVRPAGPQDLPQLAELHLRARAAAHPAMPLAAHPPAEVRSWICSWDLSVREVWLAEEAGGAGPVGYAMLHGAWLDDLYVEPAAQRRGVGAALLEVAKARRPGGFCLWVFETNRPARDFYAARGLVALERSDGSGNEAGAPDVRMAWPGEQPRAFFRALIDDVDAQLEDLLARRAALRAAVQPLEAAPARD